MQTNSTHPDYAAAAPQWSRARDVLAGDDAVKAAGARYLPRLQGQSDDEYAAYTTRASFYGATARTLEEHLDQVFRRAPVLALGANVQLKNFVADCDLWESDFLRHARHVLTEVTVDTFSIPDYHQCKTTFNKITARPQILTSDLPYYMRAAFVAALAGAPIALRKNEMTTTMHNAVRRLTSSAHQRQRHENTRLSETPLSLTSRPF